MKIRTTIISAAMLFSGGVLAGPPEHAGPPVSSVAIECNWGTLTMESILEDDFDQGGHSSDPSGDGPGREDRVGLANVLERGNLQATCEFIEDILNQ